MHNYIIIILVQVK